MVAVTVALVVVAVVADQTGEPGGEQHMQPGA